MAKKNVTVQVEEALLKHARHVAIEEDSSLSEWIANLISAAVQKSSGRESLKRQAMTVLNKPLKLGGAVFSRDELHER